VSYPTAVSSPFAPVRTFRPNFDAVCGRKLALMSSSVPLVASARSLETVCPSSWYGVPVCSVVSSRSGV